MIAAHTFGGKSTRDLLIETVTRLIQIRGDQRTARGDVPRAGKVGQGAFCLWREGASAR